MLCNCYLIVLLDPIQCETSMLQLANDRHPQSTLSASSNLDFRVQTYYFEIKIASCLYTCILSFVDECLQSCSKNQIALEKATDQHHKNEEHFLFWGLPCSLFVLLCSKVPLPRHYLEDLSVDVGYSFKQI